MKVVLPKLKMQLLAMLMIFCIVGTSCAQTQRKPDVILLRDESKLEVLIQEVDENVVKYKKLTDPEGPLFSVKKSEITSIRYGNGEVETFEAVLEVPSYYSPSVPKQPEQARQSDRPRSTAPMKPSQKFADDVRTASPDHLRTMYTYYKTRSKGGMIMGIAGTAVGVLVAGIGTGIVASAVDANGNYKSYQDEQRAIKGAWMMIGGFAGAVTFGTVGFVKAGKNGSKASRIRKELIRRGEPLTFRIGPGFNPVQQVGYLTVNIRF